MSRPILPTPPIEGEDARALAESLQGGASEAEMQRRAAVAERMLNALGASKARPPGAVEVGPGLFVMRDVRSVFLDKPAL